MPRRLAQPRMTLSDLEWPFHASSAISAVAELLVSYNGSNSHDFRCLYSSGCFWQLLLSPVRRKHTFTFCLKILLCVLAQISLRIFTFFNPRTYFLLITQNSIRTMVYADSYVMHGNGQLDDRVRVSNQSENGCWVRTWDDVIWTALWRGMRTVDGSSCRINSSASAYSDFIIIIIIIIKTKLKS